MNQIIPPINQFEIKPCLLITERQNVNLASEEYHSEFWMLLDVQKILNNQQYRSFLPGVRINVKCRIQVNPHAFHFSKTPNLDKIYCLFVFYRLAVKMVTHAMLT